MKDPDWQRHIGKSACGTGDIEAQTGRALFSHPLLSHVKRDRGETPGRHMDTLHAISARAYELHWLHKYVQEVHATASCLSDQRGIRRRRSIPKLFPSYSKMVPLQIYRSHPNHPPSSSHILHLTCDIINKRGRSSEGRQPGHQGRRGRSRVRPCRSATPAACTTKR